MKFWKLIVGVAAGLVLAVAVVSVPFWWFAHRRPEAVLERSTPGWRVPHGADSVRLANLPDSLFHRAADPR